MDTLTTLVTRLAKRVDRHPTDSDFKEAWATLHVEGWRVADLTTPGEFDDCVKRLRERLKAQPRRGRRGGPAWVREAYVRADRAAEEVERDSEVRSFRDEVLSGRLLELSAVGDWVRAHAGRYGGLDSLVAFPDVDHVGRVPVMGSPELERLKALATRLEDEQRWTGDVAVAFVLTGAVPLRWPIRTTINWSDKGMAVQLSVEPWVPANAVKAAYVHARRTGLRSSTNNRSARRPDRRFALAGFAAAHVGLPARAQLERWNESFPKWRFRDVRNFVRDARRAIGHSAHDSAHRR
jgi:hypothetical protein